jgi:hypothetical protein
VMISGRALRATNPDSKRDELMSLGDGERKNNCRNRSFKRMRAASQNSVYPMATDGLKCN